MTSFAYVAPWLGVLLLGAYHGANPGMGWLFAVARGMQERSRTALLLSLAPIALGHEAAVLLVLAAVSVLEPVAGLRWLKLGAALTLVAFAAVLLVRRRLHPSGFGMRMGPVRLGWWSFLMSSAHGAGLMLAPLFLGISATAPVAGVPEVAGPLGLAALAASLHVAGLVIVMGGVALTVYERLGVSLLRRAWVNLDLIWSVALLGAGGVALFT